MAELRTPGGPTDGDPPFDPPRGDEGLDDWFARRLEAQGIQARRPRIPIARVLAVVALVAALGALGWVLAGASSPSTKAASTTTPTTASIPTGTTSKTTTVKAKKPLWRKIPLTILNGFGGNNAAGTAQSQLNKAGWHVVSVADASPDTSKTIVVYVPGKLAWARVVAQRLHLPAPVPIAQAPGVLPTQTDSVAIVLGPDLLPAGAGA
jgi:LytR cell envelope-related transcriptional attenuator